MNDADAEARMVARARLALGVPDPSARTARDPVNQAMINHWCDALGDHNPAYTDAEATARTRHGGLIAPPAMLGTWTLDGSSGAAGVWETRAVGNHAAETGRPQEAGPRSGRSPQVRGPQETGPRDRALRALEDAGYTAVVATNYQQQYLRPLRLGDLLAETLTVEDISDRKETALGVGYFVTVRHDYRDADGELVGVARMTLLKFRPPDRPTAPAEEVPAAKPRRPRPPINRDTAFFWEGVANGQLLLQRCAGCGDLRHPPRPMCGTCRSTEWDTVPSAGHGEVYSYVVHHYPPLPGIEQPHVVVLIALDEGVRMVSSLTGVAPDDVRIGLPVEVSFQEVDDELTLPVFRAGVPA